jgi:hypothetical protein
MSRNTLALMALPIALLTGCDTGAPTDPAPVPAVAAPRFSTGSLIRTDDVGGPFYARINPMPPYIFADGGWVGIAFYRSPACVPADFNLLEFFDMTEHGALEDGRSFQFHINAVDRGARNVLIRFR